MYLSRVLCGSIAALVVGISGCAVASEVDATGVDVGVSQQAIRVGNEGKFSVRGGYDTVCKLEDKDQTIIRLYSSVSNDGFATVRGVYVHKTIGGVRTMATIDRGHEEHDGPQFIADNNWGYGVLQSVTVSFGGTDGPATNDGFLPEKSFPYSLAPANTTDLREQFFLNRGTVARASFPSAQLNRLVAPLVEAQNVPSTTRRGQTEVRNTPRAIVFFVSADSGYRTGGGFVVDQYISNGDMLASNGHIIPRPITKPFACERVLRAVVPDVYLRDVNVCPAGYSNKGAESCMLLKNTPDEFSGKCDRGYVLRDGSCELNLTPPSGCKADEHNVYGVCFPGN